MDIYSNKVNKFVFLFIFWCLPSFADNINVCFTPQEDCTGLIVNTIMQAKHQILVQAYSFTSAPIIKALVLAKQRGIDVRILLDKSQVKAKYSSVTYLKNQDMWFKIDNKPAIAHNKIMIIDGETVITGSFNFTKAAQEKNAENLLIIRDKDLANKYLDNWNYREQQSINLK